MKRSTHVFHLADLHIRSGNCDQSRYQEYKVVFDRVIEDLSSHPSIKTSVIVVAGDIFHHKLKIESSGIKLAIDFFTSIASLCPVYVISGNHDFRQDRPDEPDMISTLLGNIQNVTHLNETQTYKIDSSLGFGLLSIHDALQRGASSAIEIDVNATFPNPHSLNNSDGFGGKSIESCETKVALFHGSSTRLQSDPNALAYDIAMLGDIHVQQIIGGGGIQCHLSSFVFKNSHILARHSFDHALKLGPSKDICIGYPGSLIQQDHGEPLLGHGFLIWDLVEKTVDCYHTRNDYGFATSKFSKETESWSIGLKSGSNQPLSSLGREPWFPRSIALRVQVDDTIDARKEMQRASDDFQKIGILSSTITPLKLDTESFAFDFNTPLTWIEFIEKRVDIAVDSRSGASHVVDWKSWFKNPETMAIPLSNLESDLTLNARINDRNEKIMRKINDIKAPGGEAMVRERLVLKSMKWSWILCFKDDNHFDFESMEAGKITAISARNGVGKTSLLETLCIAMYGEGFPSRSSSTRSSTSSIVTLGQKQGTTILDVEIGLEMYRITRVFKFGPDGSKVTSKATIERIVSHPSNLSRKYDNDDNVLVQSGKMVVDAWIDRHIGTITSFLLSCMVTQSSDMDFFNMRSTDQKELLDKALCLDSCSMFQAAIKEARLAHHYIIDTLENRLDGVKGCTGVSIDSLGDYERQVQVIRKKVARIRSKTDNVVGLSEWKPKEQLPPQTNRSSIEEKLKNLIEKRKSKVNGNEVMIDNGNRDNQNSRDNRDNRDNQSNQSNRGSLSQGRKRNRSIVEIDIDRVGIALASVPEGVFSSAIANNMVRTRVPNTTIALNQEQLETCDKLISQSIDEVKQVHGRLMDCVYNQPPRPSNINSVQFDKQKNKKLNSRLEELENEANETCQERDIGYVKQTIDEINANIILLERATKATGLAESHPFNEECWACRQQPWKQHKDECANELKRVKKLLRTKCGSSNIETAKIFALELEKHVTNLEEIISIKWKKYENDREAIEQEKDKLEKTIKEIEKLKETKSHMNWVERQSLQEQLKSLKYELENHDEAKIQELEYELSQWNLFDIACQMNHLYEDHITCKALEIELNDMETTLIDLKVKQKLVSSCEGVEDRLTLIRSRFNVMEKIELIFEGFKHWVYTDKVLPCLTGYANRIVRGMCSGLDIQAEMCVSSNTISWRLNGPPIEKASGFQRFITGLAMRIALGKIGAAGIKCGRLFLDEGFTTCDSENVTKVSSFLHSLLPLYPEGILIVTHMEEVKSCASQHIVLARKPLDIHTRVVYGRKNEI